MRSLHKLEEPGVLSQNRQQWLADYKADKKNKTKKYRYRHHEIKATLKQETGTKCVYCESKIGHNTPGDIEHMIPSSKNEDLHFTWTNLTIACTECNRRKNDYYENGEEFLNPYLDHEIEPQILHLGPIVSWQSGNNRAEITVKVLELNTPSRIDLIKQKIEKIEDTNNLIERYTAEQNPALKSLFKRQLKEIIKTDSEYSGMILSLIREKGIDLNGE